MWKQYDISDNKAQTTRQHQYVSSFHSGFTTTIPDRFYHGNATISCVEFQTLSSNFIFYLSFYGSFWFPFDSFLSPSMNLNLYFFYFFSYIPFGWLKANIFICRFVLTSCTKNLSGNLLIFTIGLAFEKLRRMEELKKKTWILPHIPYVSNTD